MKTENIISKIKNWLRDEKNESYFVYAILAFFILGPLLKSGYALATDMIFTPKIPMPSEIGSSYLIGAFLHYLNYIIPSQIIQKILLFLAIFLAGVGMHRLAPVKNKWAKYFAGFLFIFNPFVYSRFLYGHLFTLLAYALTPWFAKTVFQFFEKMNFKNALKLGLFFTLFGFVNIHSVYFIFLFFASVWIFYIFKNIKSKKRISNAFKFSLLVGLIFFVFSSWWLVPSFLGKSQTSQFITEQIDDRHSYEFRTASDENYGVVLNTAAMYGFWGDREERYVVQKEFVPFWLEMYLFLLAIFVWGALANSKFLKKRSLPSEKKKELYILPMISVALISLVLAVGIAYEGFKPLIEFLNANIPFYKGYREPQKWVTMLILTYAYLGALGVDDLLLRFKKIFESARSGFPGNFSKCIIPLFFLIVPIAYSPGLLWGFHGQLKAVDYPQSWYEVNDILNSDPEEFNVLFLPWRQYIELDFVGKIIANPAPDFFDKPVIAGDNMEMHDIYTQSNRLESKYIEEKILKNRDEMSNLGEMLLPIEVKYVIFVQEANFLEYAFVAEQDDLELIYYKDSIQVYKSKVYGVHNVENP